MDWTGNVFVVVNDGKFVIVGVSIETSAYCALVPVEFWTNYDGTTLALPSLHGMGGTCSLPVQNVSEISTPNVNALARRNVTDDMDLKDFHVFLIKVSD